MAASVVVKEWKTKFVHFYENGDIENATEIAKLQRRNMYEQNGLEAVYKNIKSDLNSELFVKIAVWGIMALIIFGFVYMCS